MTTTDPTNVDDPGTVDPADEVAGTGLPAQVNSTTQTPSSDAGPTQEVENQPVVGTGLPANVNQ